MFNNGKRAFLIYDNEIYLKNYKVEITFDKYV